MLRPERMSRVLVVGPREKLAPTIEVLHTMRLLHIVDHHGEDHTFRMGKPLARASELSDSLVKLRSISSILAIEKTPREKETVQIDELRQKILGLELNISEEDSARKKIEGLLSDLTRRIEELRPFASLGLTLDAYRGYRSVTVVVGRVSREVSGFEAEVPRGELFVAPGVVAAFVSNEDVEKAGSLLGRFGFSQVDPPKGSGDPKALLSQATAEEEKWRGRLEEVRTRLAKLRERYASFVVAAQEALEVEVEKAEAPLRFATSDHSFVIDGWVPASGVPVFAPRVEGLGVHVETLEESGHGHNPVEPPVLLRNPRPAKPFEFLIHLYSTPSYHEIDPTVFMFLAFPFFFGFMIGDLGYGFLFVLIGVIALRKLPKESPMRNLFVTIGIGGFWALILGAFVFGEMFGIPFHVPPPPPGEEEEISWAFLGLDVPLKAPLHKTVDIADMVYLSILFAFLHLGASFLLGVVNEVRHSKKHAIAKAGFFLCLLGLFTILTRALSWTRVGGWVWEVPLGWFPRATWDFASSFLGIGIPWASVFLVLGVFLGLGESPVAPLEVGGILANIMSYARLAGIGVGKAAIAGSFNGLILHNLILDQDIPVAIGGFALLVVAQLLVFMLGGISAGIQGIRLNYVESFIKFYKGNGTRFRPFGMRATTEA